MAANTSNIRYSSIAGTWYPGEEWPLAKIVDDLLAEAELPSIGINQSRLRALFVPHAGLIYSGGVAACAYRWLRGEKFKRVVLIGPSHFQHFGPWATTTFSHYQTPLGLVAVDQPYIEKIAEKIPLPRIPENIEHSLEIQLPFLQRILSAFSILPILSGDLSLEAAQALAEALEETLDEGQTLIIASSDLSHYHDSSTAEEMDRRLISRIETLEAERLARDLEIGECEACGGGGILAAMLLARMYGATIKTLKYSHSGMVTGDNMQVVGYLAAIAYHPA